MSIYNNPTFRSSASAHPVRAAQHQTQVPVSERFRPTSDDFYGAACVSEGEISVLARRASIDVGQDNSAGSRLAQEGRLTQCDRLLRCGASPSIMAYGAALGGQREFVRDLINLRGASVDEAARGAAAAGDLYFARELKGLGASPEAIVAGATRDVNIFNHSDVQDLICEQDIDPSVIAAAAARQGNFAIADEYRALTPLESEEGVNQEIILGAALHNRFDVVRNLDARANYLSSAVFGLSKAGLFDEAFQYVARGGHPSEIGRGAAVAGHSWRVEYAIDHEQADLNEIAHDYALGGHRAKAEELLQLGVNINAVAEGAGQFGDRVFSESLIRRGASLDALAAGAVKGGHLRFVRDLVYRGANPRRLVPLAQEVRRHSIARELQGIIRLHASLQRLRVPHPVSSLTQPQDVLTAHSRLPALRADNGAGRVDVEPASTRQSTSLPRIRQPRRGAQPTAQPAQHQAESQESAIPSINARRIAPQSSLPRVRPVDTQVPTANVASTSSVEGDARTMSPLTAIETHMVELGIPSDFDLTDHTTEDTLNCPITQTLMRDPVTASDGHTYDRTSLERHLQVSGLSPLTRERLDRSKTVETYAMRNVICKYLTDNKETFKQRASE